MLPLGQAEGDGDEESGDASELGDDDRVTLDLELHEQVWQGIEEGGGEVLVLASN